MLSVFVVTCVVIVVSWLLVKTCDGASELIGTASPPTQQSLHSLSAKYQLCLTTSLCRNETRVGRRNGSPNGSCDVSLPLPVTPRSHIYIHSEIVVSRCFNHVVAWHRFRITFLPIAPSLSLDISDSLFFSSLLRGRLALYFRVHNRAIRLVFPEIRQRALPILRFRGAR